MIVSEQSSVQGSSGPVHVERWPTEIPLLIFVGLAAACLWVLIAVSIIGLIYGLFIGLFLFLSQIAFVAHVRGSAVRLGPDQFPDLYRRVQDLSARAGIDPVPEAYVMQAGGSLNALATAFLRSRIIVLFSELLDACGDDDDARDMIIGHELGHIRAGHLSWRWLLFPGFLVPFLGSAYSRARELTCDRYGAALCRDRRGALTGLGILAAGGSHGRKVNLRALASQRALLDTGWMTLGKWIATHPPLSERIAALEPGDGVAVGHQTQGPVRALGILAVLFLMPVAALGILISSFIPRWQQAMAEARAPVDQAEASGVTDDEWIESQIWGDFQSLALAAESHKKATGMYPDGVETLYETWHGDNPGGNEPLDPYDGQRYGYNPGDGGFTLWSAGPDRQGGTDDDLWAGDTAFE